MKNTEKQDIRLVISPPMLSGIIADPTVLSPDQSPDKKWHLFAHSYFGIHHYISEDGLKWKDIKLIRRFALRQYIYTENNLYYLVYEKLDKFLPYLPVYASHIEIISSSDLINWSKPKTIFKHCADWHNNTLCNPCIIKEDNKYILHFNANFKFFLDTLIAEPRYSGKAQSDVIDGEYTNITQIENENHVVYRYRDNVEYKTVWYYDEKKNSHAKILKNGEDYILPSNKNDFRKSFTYVCDSVVYKNKRYTYFNARDGGLIAIERIGLLIEEAL